MTRQVVTTTPHNSGLGDPAFTAFEKLSANDAELYAAAGVTGATALSAATYAIARTLTGTTTGDRLQVLGRTAQSDGGQGLFTWVAGGTTTVNDGIELSATGGIWRRAGSIDLSTPYGPATTLSAAWFGILPTNADTVNDVGFATLKAAMLADTAKTWRVVFAKGAYTYQVNRWLFGVLRVIVDAYDCSFRCTTGNTTYNNRIPLYVGDFNYASGDIVQVALNSLTYQNGDLINSAVQGATTVTCTTAANGGHYSAGMPVIIYGYDQQFVGYPPNLRYFDYQTVESASAGTGVVQLSGQLKNAYDSRWWETTNYGGLTGMTWGAPRILSLANSNYKLARLVWIKGATFLANDVATPTSGAVQLCADLLILEDVTGFDLSIYSSRETILKRCYFTYGAAGDKLMDVMKVEDCVISSGFTAGVPWIGSSINDCVGTNNVVLKNSTFIGEVNISPRNMTMENCDVIPYNTAQVGIHTAGSAPIWNVNIKDTRVYVPANAASYGHSGSFRGGFNCNAYPGVSITVGSVNGHDIQLTFDQTVASLVDYGMLLVDITGGDNSGYVTGIFKSGANLVIQGTWGTPTVGNVFAAYDVMNAYDGGGNSLVGGQVAMLNGADALPFWVAPNNLKGLQINGAPATAVGGVYQALSSGTKQTTLPVASQVTLTTATPALVTSIRIGTGTYLVWGTIDFALAGATTTLFAGSISDSVALKGQPGGAGIGPDPTNYLPLVLTTATQTYTLTVGPTIVANFANYYDSFRNQLDLVAQATFSAGTVKAYGTLNAILLSGQQLGYQQ